MSHEAILQATWRALCTTGYVDLTMQDIADETDMTKAALHYHYDSKQELLAAFLDHVADRFRTRLQEADPGPGSDPGRRLTVVLDAALSPPERDELELLQRALVELKAQAPHEERFRERLSETDEQFKAFLAEILADGVASGAFRSDLDPDETAEYVALLLAGSQLRQVSIGQDDETTRRLIEAHFERQLFEEAGNE